MLLQLALIVIAFAVLSRSADEAIKRLILLSRRSGVSEFAISFVIAGTLAILPELSIGVNSALDAAPSFGLGIIFGSNIADLTLVLGAVALFSGGIALEKPASRASKWFLLGVVLPLALLIPDGELSRLDGTVLIAAYAAYAAMLMRDGRKHHKRGAASRNPWADALVLVAAIAVMLLCGKVITDASEAFSIELGLPIFFIGIVLAVGTCLPEMTMAVRAAQQNHGSLGFGNILGNVFADCMLTLGIIALISPIRPDPYPMALGSGLLMMLSMGIVLFLLRGKNRLTRSDGLLLVVLYFLFLLVQAFGERLALSA